MKDTWQVIHRKGDQVTWTDGTRVVHVNAVDLETRELSIKHNHTDRWGKVKEAGTCRRITRDECEHTLRWLGVQS